MGTKWLSPCCRWAVRMLAVILAGGFCLLIFGEKIGGRLGLASIEQELHAPDQLMFELAVGGVLILALVWIWERWGDRTDVVLAAIFALACILIGGAHPLWLAAAAVLSAVALYWLGAKSSRSRRTPE